MEMNKTSNYEIMRDRMSGEFAKYDQEKMIARFGLQYDEKYLYVRFVARNYRIDRVTGAVEWLDDGFATVHAGDYNEAMTIYDVLSRADAPMCLSGRYCTTDQLKGTVQTANGGGNLFKRSSDFFAGNTEKLAYVMAKLGRPTTFKADVAVEIPVFDFLPVVFQFWDADDEFPSVLKFMVDENMQQYMHFETVMFLLFHILGRIREEMEAL